MDTDIVSDDEGLTSKKRAKALLGDISDSTFYRLAEAKLIEIVKIGSASKATNKSLRKLIAEAPRQEIRRHKREAA